MAIGIYNLTTYLVLSVFLMTHGCILVENTGDYLQDKQCSAAPLIPRLRQNRLQDIIVYIVVLPVYSFSLLSPQLLLGGCSSSLSRLLLLGRQKEVL